MAKRDTYQIEPKTYVLFRLCLNWKMNGKLFFFVIKEMFLVATLDGRKSFSHMKIFGKN